MSNILPKSFVPYQKSSLTLGLLPADAPYVKILSNSSQTPRLLPAGAPPSTLDLINNILRISNILPNSNCSYQKSSLTPRVLPAGAPLCQDLPIHSTS